MTWPDPDTYMTVKRARVLRVEIDAEREWAKHDRAGHTIRPCSVCGSRRGSRRFMNGWLCTLHAPRVPVPDPSRTLAALRDAPPAQHARDRERSTPMTACARPR